MNVELILLNFYRRPFTDTKLWTPALHGTMCSVLDKVHTMGREFSTNTWRIVEEAGRFALIQRQERYARRLLKQSDAPKSPD